jgi:TolA-binding protein
MICKIKREMKRIAALLFLVMMYLPPIILCGQQSDLVLAEKLMNEGLYELAYDEFIEFAERNDDSPDVAKAYYLAYDCLFLQGRYDDAVLKFKQFIRIFPLSPFAAFAHERMG